MSPHGQLSAFAPTATLTSVPSTAILRAATALQDSGALTLLRDAIDGPAARSRTGSTDPVPHEAVVIARFSCHLARIAPTARAIHAILTDPTMPTIVRTALGLPVADDHENMTVEAARQQISYGQVRRRLALIHRLLGTETGALAGTALADQLALAMLGSAWQQVPEDARSNWPGDIHLDAAMLSAGRPKTAAKRRTSGNPESFASWHTLDNPGTRQALADNRTAPKRYPIGYAVHVAATSVGGGGFSAPLILGLQLTRPGNPSPSSWVGDLIARLRGDGAPAGFLTFCRHYAPEAASLDHTSARALGYRVAFGYSSYQVGIQAAVDGAVMVDGTWYCDGMPMQLCTASADVQSRVVSDASYARPLAQRDQYRLRGSRVSNRTGAIRYARPHGSGSRARCPHGCTQPVKIQGGAHVKPRQDLAYQSPAWRTAYHGGRAVGHSALAGLTEHLGGTLGQPSLVGAAVLDVILAAAAFNVRSIAMISLAANETDVSKKARIEPASPHPTSGPKGLRKPRRNRMP